MLITQSAVAQLAAWAQSAFSDGERDGLLASTSLSFDLSVFEIIVTLALGGRVVLVDDVLALAEPGFAAHVSFINTVPSAIAAVLANAGLPETVRTVALAGEALPQSLVDRLYAQASVDAVWNLYGPTEDTTYSTAHLCKPGQRPLIGRPLPGTRCYIVDRHLQPVGEGLGGELLLAGTGLAAGYLGRDGLTAERFVEVEFGDRAPERAYRTGDRARFTPTGELDYLGRLDDQVKIRGVRVEPAELEHALRDHSGVDDAAVIVEDHNAGKRLLAYVTGPSVDVGTLEAELAERLPAALLPDAITALDVLPITRNGKLDRRALPRPGATAAAGGEPATETERRLALVWAEVLELPVPPGPRDDFFKLGGDSLNILELLSAIEETFSRRLSVRVLLGAPRLADQADAIEQATGSAAAAALIPLRRTGSARPFICVLTDHRGIIALRNVLPATLTDQPVWAMQAIDPSQTSWRSSSIEQIASACLAAVRQSWPDGPYRLGGHSMGGLVAFEMAVRLEQDGAEIDRLVLLDTIPPGAFRWTGRIERRLRLTRGEPALHRLQTLLGMARMGLEDAWSLARGGPPLREWPRGFEDPFDRAGAGRVMRRYHPRQLTGELVMLSTERSEIDTGTADLGWRRHAAGPVTVRRVPGDHTTMFAQPHIRALANTLAEELART